MSGSLVPKLDNLHSLLGEKFSAGFNISSLLSTTKDGDQTPPAVNKFRSLEEAALFNIPTIQRRDLKKWKQACPVRYRRVKGYLPQEAAVAALLQGMQADSEGAALHYFARFLTSIGTPTWWVGRDIGKSLLQTSLPSGITLQKVNLPLTHFAMLLPEGLIPFGNDGDSIALLCFGYLSPNEIKILQGLGGANSVNEAPLRAIDSIEHFSSPIHEERRMFGCASVYGWSFKDRFFDAYPSPNADLDALNIYSMANEGYSQDDQAFTSVINSFILNCAFVISNRPDLIESVDPQVSSRHKHTLKGDALASPKWIGKHYVQKDSRAENRGSHSSPSMHWRRGHWRNQPTGNKEQKQYKYIWIEPVLVGSLNSNV